MAALADKRADLGLQVSLLAEHEITRILTLVTEAAKKWTFRPRTIRRLRTWPLLFIPKPETVLDTMERHERASPWRSA